MVYPRIRKLREEADLSQRELAEIIHMHKTTYTRYETGEREIPFNIAILLAQYYKVSLDYIAGLTDVKNIK
ncbi:helix-turn-helix domain-containing protein [Anaeropeptidivorans aminofermentans]|uniref:helix-turn-helix domain-containing protein n=1 Tax=Anaeropeptidivorans aminofermentans TaxID=2934315 RepID=UPI002024141A|nr:helix-turn-helix transcriptional regulator [Anaeropeptidivorans aminofermentans]MBE6012819.1 helix-turn-helix transcriptional regulator [Lachnospiraceae bacterium]